MHNIGGRVVDPKTAHGYRQSGYISAANMIDMTHKQKIYTHDDLLNEVGCAVTTTSLAAAVSTAIAFVGTTLESIMFEGAKVMAVNEVGSAAAASKPTAVTTAEIAFVDI